MPEINVTVSFDPNSGAAAAQVRVDGEPFTEPPDALAVWRSLAATARGSFGGQAAAAVDRVEGLIGDAVAAQEATADELAEHRRAVARAWHDISGVDATGQSAMKGS